MHTKNNIFSAFAQNESTPGIVLFLAAAFAIVMANSGLSGKYEEFTHYYVFGTTVGHIVNDGLMAIFFLFIGLEMKKELVEGELSALKTAILPLIGAAGGMLLPALIYLYFNYGNPNTAAGWAIPTATDIAFVVGILSLFSKRLPASLMIFLLALAVIDDMGAVIVIAAFYTSDINVTALVFAIISVLFLVLLGKWKVSSIYAYLMVGAFLWFFVLKSGIHSTIAGVLLGLLIPLRAYNKDGESISVHLEHQLKPWVNFAIMPLFAFVNAGVSLAGVSFANLTDDVALGILLGLFVGKQLGIFSFIWIAIKMGFADKPHHASWPQIYAVCICAGIGFTMSLFIGLLAFPDPIWQVNVKIGVLSGSLLSALAGYALLQFTTPKKERVS